MCGYEDDLEDLKNERAEINEIQTNKINFLREINLLESNDKRESQQNLTQDSRVSGAKL